MGVPLARRVKALDEIGAAIDSLQLVVFPCNILYFQNIKKEAGSRPKLLLGIQRLNNKDELLIKNKKVH